MRACVRSIAIAIALLGAYTLYNTLPLPIAAYCFTMFACLILWVMQGSTPLLPCPACPTFWAVMLAMLAMRLLVRTCACQLRTP